MSKKISQALTLTLILAAAITLSACTISTKSNGSGELALGNIFLSTDMGGNWRAASAVPTPNGKLENISGVEISGFFKDPSDNLAVYLGTAGNGLYFTYNVTKGWNKAAGIPEARVNSVAVDPKDKCTIYVASLNRLYRSEDCARSFSQVYYDNDGSVSVKSVAVDFYNPKNVYIGTSRGEIIKSIDRGLSWRSIWRMEQPIERIVLSPKDSRKIFIATDNNKVFSFISNTNTDASTSADINANFAAEDFRDLNAALKDMDLGKRFVDLVITDDETIFFTTANLIARSKDAGVTWESLNLIQPEGDTGVTAMAADPKDINNLYYATASTFLRSSDGGATWSTKKLPTSWVASSLMVDFKDGKNIYLGAVKPPKK